jgi:hypothetical protein
MPVLGDRDVIVDPGPGLAPGGELIPGRRQRPQRRAVQLLEQFPPAAVQLLERPGVQLPAAPSDCRIRLARAGELPVTQPGDDPPLAQQDTRFSLGLIFRLVSPGRHDRHAVMGGHLGEGGIDVRLVTIRRGHRRAKIIRHDDLRAAPKRLEAAHMRGHPVRQLLGRKRLGIHIAGSAQHRDEQLRVQRDLAGRRVVDGDRVAGKIYEQLLPGRMDLAHGHVDTAAPGPVQICELRIAVPVRVSLPVLHPQQLQRHVLVPSQLAVHLLPVRDRPGRARRRRRRKQQRLQPSVVQILRQRPLQPRCRRPDQVLVHRGLRHARGHAGQPLAQPLTQPEPENITDLAHVHAGSRHRGLFLGLVDYVRVSVSAPGTSVMLRHATDR